MADSTGDNTFLWEKGVDFEDLFDSDIYLTTYFREVEKYSFIDIMMRDFHDYFSTGRGQTVKGWYICRLKHSPPANYAV